MILRDKYFSTKILDRSRTRWMIYISDWLWSRFVIVPVESVPVVPIESADVVGNREVCR